MGISMLVYGSVLLFSSTMMSDEDRSRLLLDSHSILPVFFASKGKLHCIVIIPSSAAVGSCFNNCLVAFHTSNKISAMFDEYCTVTVT